MYIRFILTDILARIDDKSSRDQLGSTENKFDKDISRIGQDLSDYGTQLSIESTRDDTFETYDKRHEIYNERLMESLEILYQLYGDDKDKCEKAILKVAKQCKKKMKEGSDESDVILRRWKNLNKRWNQSYYQVKQILRGINTRKVLNHSVYLFLQAENVEALDLFWREYFDGTLKSKLLATMLKNSRANSENISITVTEENYMRYRAYIGKSIFE